jgi:hypothetical protein
MFKEVFEVNAKINESEYTKKLNIHYIPWIFESAYIPRESGYWRY